MNTCLYGDCRETLKTLPDQSVQCCITSPPYFGLRDYGHADQIGLEPSPEEYVAELVAVFREVRRVLRDDGTLWLNIGDSYATTSRSSGASMASTLNTKPTAAKTAAQRDRGTWKTGIGDAKQKDLIGIPWRVAFALQADGWYLRQDIIWAKPNPMPESVTDRCTKAHEYLFLLSKSQRYHFDAEAIAERAVGATGGAPSGTIAARAMGRVGTDAGLAAGWASPSTERNRRSVWNIATQPFSGAHFAVMPPDLVKPCVLAGCPVGGIVLDPFFGSGTVGMVAEALGRQWIGCELNTQYRPLIEQRTAQLGMVI